MNNYSKNTPPLKSPKILVKKQNNHQKEPELNIILGNILGKGSHGIVYSCNVKTKTLNKTLAVKCLNNKTNGISSLIETSIMSIIRHPNINHAINIYSTPSKTFILQELAISDLKNYRNQNNIDTKILLVWIHKLVQGISCLHKYNIIHGDIKSQNILVYSNNQIKLSDFTLSTNDNWVNMYRPCTPTHRPLEVWMNKNWTNKVDIWALGCTIYEIYYNNFIFPYQTTDASINAILDWEDCFNDFSHKNKSVKKNTTYKCYKTIDNFGNSYLDRLIIKLLSVNQNKRPNIKNIISDNLFKQFSVSPYVLIPCKFPILNKKTEKKIKKYIKCLISNKITINLTYDLFTRLQDLTNIGDILKISTCAWMAHKLVSNENIPLVRLPVKLYEIIKTERIICKHLSFKLRENLINKNI